jgi:hypothetical protein
VGFVDQLLLIWISIGIGGRQSGTWDLGRHHDRRFRRFVTMATIDSEPRPGTAFKKIMEEQAMLDEFMAMMKKKYGIIVN